MTVMAQLQQRMAELEIQKEERGVQDRLKHLGLQPVHHSARRANFWAQKQEGSEDVDAVEEGSDHVKNNSPT
ncbi:hypothetical protein GN956_G8277 [Arapaima gigas]